MNELFRKETLLIDQEPHSWQDAIKVTGKLMLEIGAISEGYIDAMISAVETIGPYIVVAPHLAIAHAAAGTHVIQNDMVLVVFKEPVLFHTENDPVHVMVGLCALQPGSHLDQLTMLADVFTDEDVWSRFLACETVTELYELVNGQSN